VDRGRHLKEVTDVKIAVIGAGHIGGNIARRLALAGHEVTICFSRDEDELQAQARKVDAQAARPGEAVRGAEVVVLSVPWGAIPIALEQAGSLEGKIVIDTTNQFGPGPKPQAGQTAAAFNVERMPGARYTKSFNTLTAAFQIAAANRPVEDRVVQWLCGDDQEAKRIVAGLIEDAAYAPVDLGGTADCAVMEAPRRSGAVYGEEYRRADAKAVVKAVHAGQPIPVTPNYEQVPA
jgi:8-hydroxy-5-deazaflavin:NADPH oxidoreductase